MSTPTPRPRDWLLLLALVAMWGSSFLLTKLAVATLPPTAVVAGRLSIAALVLATMALVRGHRPPVSITLWGYFIAMGVVGSSLPFFLISWGQQHIDSALAGILMAVMPLVTLVLAHF
ncbi:MAG: DMT family transporter, partial [Candidatus Competibacteraceae bacterium]|nr:DMT family transporter [Candidatus Competibacteraceae bacterium]